MELFIEIVGDIIPDAKASDYGLPIYWGIMLQGGASVEAATVSKRELIKAPVCGEELPFSRFTRGSARLSTLPNPTGKNRQFL